MEPSSLTISGRREIKIIRGVEHLFAAVAALDLDRAPAGENVDGVVGRPRAGATAPAWRRWPPDTSWWRPSTDARFDTGGDVVVARLVGRW